MSRQRKRDAVLRLRGEDPELVSRALGVTAALSGWRDAFLAAGEASLDSVEDLRRAPTEFRDTYNTTWLIERHGFLPPVAICAE